MTVGAMSYLIIWSFSGYKMNYETRSDKTNLLIYDLLRRECISVKLG